MPTILMTGSGGFIGRHVLEALAGHGRIVTTRENVLKRPIDLLDPAQRRALVAAERPDILIHLAWVTAHGAFWGAAENRDWEEASADLFDLAYRHGARRIVATGSCAEYDWSTGADRFSENAPVAPGTVYGSSKVRTSARLAELAAAYGREWAWGRVFFCFGPGEPEARLIPTLLRAALANRPVDCGPSDTYRDFWDVRCLGGAIVALALSQVSGFVNLASGNPLSFGELGAIIEKLSGRSGVVRTGMRALRPGEPRSLVADISRLRDEVGFRASIDLEAGLAQYLSQLEARVD